MDPHGASTRARVCDACFSSAWARAAAPSLGGGSGGGGGISKVSTATPVRISGGGSEGYDAAGGMLSQSIGSDLPDIFSSNPDLFVVDARRGGGGVAVGLREEEGEILLREDAQLAEVVEAPSQLGSLNAAKEVGGGGG